MELKYDNQKVEKYFNDFTLFKKKIGLELARITKKRYDGLRAAKNFGVYLSTHLGKPHPLTGNLKGCYGISVSANIRLVIEFETVKVDLNSLKDCDTVTIKGVVDYHGQKQEWLIP